MNQNSFKSEKSVYTGTWLIHLLFWLNVFSLAHYKAQQRLEYKWFSSLRAQMWGLISVPTSLQTSTLAKQLLFQHHA